MTQNIIVSAQLYGRDERLGAGTRFRIYPQAPVTRETQEPETIWVSPQAGTLQPGPADARMYVVDPIDKLPYDHEELPPYRGACHPPVSPGRDGHFDHLHPGSQEFLPAHTYGTLRFVLDVWEKYFGSEIPWHFADDYERLEIIPTVRWNNAQCGYGFVEFGMYMRGAPETLPLCLNFDVVAHEIGHAFIYTLLGIPVTERLRSQYIAFHESAADCVAMIAALHFDSVVDRLLANTRGNIYLPNELNRIGELSSTEQIRNASHSFTLTQVPSIELPILKLSNKERHDMSLPLTGAVFDTLVEVFQEILAREQLISTALNKASRQTVNPLRGAIQRGFDESYFGKERQFKAALLDARDYTARCLVNAWRRLDWNLTYKEIARAMLKADQELSGGAARRILLDCLLWRQIDPR